MLLAAGNPDLFELTAEFIHHTSQNIFLTGKAGTGKTTFLRHIRKTCRKNMVVVAPTGVAAINAGGVTAHSFFQLPLGTFIPGSFRNAFHSESAVTDKHHLLRNLRLSNEKRDLIQSLELVIVDEVSMMRCDMLDAVDTVLRHIRKNHREPFGGIQMLFIGDLYQLPPVTKQEEWNLLKEHYASPFFFESLVYKQATPVCIELKTVFRQSDEQFIHLLNRVRNNQTDDDDLEKLQRLFQPGFRPKPEDHYITLTTHNYKADEINSRELKRLPGREFLCEATLKGEFPDRIFPVEKVLRLKPGAQIMFVRNDNEEKKYFNGKIGVIKEEGKDHDGEFIKVEFPETREVIRVGKITWHNIRYSFNQKDNKIDEEELGSFTNYPVRLAWAVTIHKSQGLTFQRAVIDAGSAFAAGQVYVALSRCVSMEGIVLLSAIRSHVIMTDEAIVRFMNQQEGAVEFTPLLQSAKEEYAIRKAITLFDLKPFLNKLSGFTEYIGERQIDDKQLLISQLHTIRDSIIKLDEVAEKFQTQVKEITSAGLNEPSQKKLDERIQKAKEYFEREMDEKLNGPLTKLNIELQKKKKVRKALGEMKSFMLFAENFTSKFSLDPEKRRGRIQPPPLNAGSENIPQEHKTNLFELLRKLRWQFAEEENVAPYMVCNDATLKELSTYLPLNMNDLAAIKGMGDRTLDKYGEKFLAAVQGYCSMNRLTSKMDFKKEEVRQARIAKKNKPAVDGDSKSQSFQLFKAGKTIAEIAVIRSFSVSTIEGHLAHYVKTGALDVLQVITREKIELIKEAMANIRESGFGPVKNYLGDAVSYSEIRFAIAYLDSDANKATA